jgi:hypothetical protein
MHVVHCNLKPIFDYITIMSYQCTSVEIDDLMILLDTDYILIVGCI